MIGYETSEVLDVKAAEYFVELTKREKRACKKCEEQGVVAAPRAARIIDKSLVSDRVIIDTLVRKYADHCPLYRQSSILKRDTGIEISRGTMCGWILRVGDLLIPVAGAMRRELLAEVTSKPTKHRWMCRPTMAAEQITRPICGSTELRAERRCLIFA